MASTSSGLCRCGTASESVSCCSSHLKLSGRGNYLKLDHSTVTPRVGLYQNPQWPKLTKLCERIVSLLHTLSRHTFQCAIHRVSKDVQLFSFNFLTHQCPYFKVELCLKRCPLAHFMLYLRHCLTIFKHQLQNRCTVAQKIRTV